MTKRSIICISCGAKVVVIGSAGGKRILRCGKCGLGLTEGLESFNEYESYHRDCVYIKEENLFRNVFQKRVSIISKFKNSGKALEIGSSTGVLLSLLKERGWEVLGIEPSKDSSTIAINRGIPTLNTTFELSKLAKNSFDLIIFNHVLEHMIKPIEVLRKARLLLKEDGIILIDVPNFGGITARIKGPLWEYILPSEHRWHWTKVSLKNILQKANFRMIFSETHSGIWEFASPMSELLESFKGRKKRFIVNIITVIPSLAITFLNLGSGLTIVAKR